MSCENDRDAYTFRFADVLVVAKNLVEKCVGTAQSEALGLLGWGGVDILGDSVTFYVSVGKPFKPKPITSTTSAIPVALVSGTPLDPTVEIS